MRWSRNIKNLLDSIALIDSLAQAQSAVTTSITVDKKTFQHTALLKQEFARADTIVKDRLDGLIRQFEETNAQFVMAYENARKITDTGSQPKPPATPPTP